MTIKVERLNAFMADGKGGNPAAVAIVDHFPSDREMQRIAAEIGYSETVFAVSEEGRWRVRYFAPVGEVSFCGHATIALGAALGARFGPGIYRLLLRQGEVEVTAKGNGTVHFVSAPTGSEVVPEAHLAHVLGAFGLCPADLDPTVPPRLVMAGARHLLLTLRDRERLSSMDYAFEEMRDFMRHEKIATIALVWREEHDRVHMRNAFAFGNIFEDPATGAAAAAIGGYLRELDELDFEDGLARLTFLQGMDMGQPCVLYVEVGAPPGTGVAVAGAVGVIEG